MISKSYEDTSIVVFGVWMFTRSITILYNQVFLHNHLTSFEVDVRLTQNSCWLPTLVFTTYCHICLCYEEYMESVHLEGYTNIYPLPIVLLIIFMCSLVD